MAATLVRTDDTAASGRSPAALSTAQVAAAVGFGAAYWFVAALFVRWLGEPVFREDSPWLPVAFVLALPAVWLALQLARLVARLGTAAVLPAVVVMTISATLLDGVALTWYPHLYGQEGQVLARAAAWILWGAGLGLLVGFREAAGPTRRR